MNHIDIINEFTKWTDSLYKNYCKNYTQYDNSIKFYFFIINNIHLLSKADKEQHIYFCYLFRCHLESVHSKQKFIRELLKHNLTSRECQKILNHFLKSKYRVAIMITLIVALLFSGIGVINTFLLNKIDFSFNIPLIFVFGINIIFIILILFFTNRWRSGK